MPRFKLVLIASLACLSGCANPRVPDFMVDGTLPRFGGGEDRPKPEQVAVAEPPTKAKPAPNPEVIPAPKPAKAPVQPQAQTPPPVMSARPEAAPRRSETAPAPARTAPPPVAKQTPVPVAVAEPPMVGGFQPFNDKRKTQTVAVFAADAAPIGYLLKDIKSVRSQVVAGTNYELCLKVRRAFRETSGWRTRLAKAVVYEDLQGELTLMAWSEVDTCP